MKTRPSQINFFSSISDLRAESVRKISLAEAEKQMAVQRKIRRFCWIEGLEGEYLSDADEKRLISSDRLAICYFGPDIGYGVVCIQPISKGEIMIFAGEILHSQIDPDNPYIAQLVSGTVIDAKRKGGFASLVTDLPGPGTFKELSKYKLANTEQVAVENLRGVVLQYKSGQEIVAFEAMEDIPKGQILGAEYPPSLRLRYKHYVGFFKSGDRLTPELTDKLNHVFFKSFKYQFLPIENLEQVIKNIKKEKIEKALMYLEQSHHRHTLLTQLYDEELQVLLSALKSCEDINRQQLKNMIDAEIKNRIDERPNFTQRQISDLILRSNLKQFSQRERGEIKLLNEDLSLCFVRYPEIAQDFKVIADHWRGINYSVVARIFLRLNQLFGGDAANDEVSGLMVKSRLM